MLARVAPPPGLVARLRWSFLVIYLLRLASLLPQLGARPDHGAQAQAGATPLVVATGAWWVRCDPLAGLLNRRRPDEVMRASDDAMHHAEQGGRGRVVVEGGAPARSSS